MLKANREKRRDTETGIRNALIFLAFFSFLILPGKPICAQETYSITRADSLALENVIVETYYVANTKDFTDTSSFVLPEGAVTYRIYIDMKPGYSLQVVYGDKNHELYIKTSTTFYNDKECFAETGFNIDAKKLHLGTVALDSWITMGAATRIHTGILRTEDNVGFSLITNRESLSKIDGLTKAALPAFRIFNLDLNFFRTNSTANTFSTNNGGWAATGGVKGPTPENKVLIAQLTTTGKLTFGLNVQIGTPTGGYIQFVSHNPEGAEIQFQGLSLN